MPPTGSSIDESSANPSFAERHWGVLLGLILILAAGLRAYGLGRLSVWYDESTSLFALQYVDWDFRFLKAEETRLIPLNTLLLFVWYHAVDALPGVEMGTRTSDALLDLLPATFSLLAVPLVFALGRYLTGRAAAGLGAALLAAISPFHLYYASELGPHSLYACMVLAAAYFNVRALEENRLRFWIGTVIFEALAFYAYYFSVFYLVAVNLFVLTYARTYRPLLLRWFLSQVFALLLVLPAIVLAIFVFRVHHSAQEHWFPYPTLTTLAVTVKDWFAGYSPRPRIYWPLFLLALGLFACGAWSMRGRPRRLVYLLFAAFLPLVMQWAFWNTQNFAFYTMRIQLAYSLPGFVLAGAGLAALRWRALRWGALIVLAAFSVPALQDEYAQRIHPVFMHRLGVRLKVDNRGVAEYIRNKWHEGDVVAHASTVSLGPFRYHYLPNAPQAFTGFGDEEWQAHIRNYPDIHVWESLGFVPQRIDEFVAKAKRVWFVSAAWEPSEYFELGILLREWLDAHGVRMLHQHLTGIDLYCYDMTQPPGAPAEMNRVGDAGWQTILQTAPPGPPVSNVPMGEFNPSPPLDPAALDVSFSPLPGAWYFGPKTTNGKFLFDIRMRNRSEEARDIHVRVWKAAQWGTALSLSRPPGTEAWRPIMGHDGRVSYLGRTSPEIPDAPISGWIQTRAPADLYVELEKPIDPAAVPRGDLVAEVRVGDSITPVGTIAGTSYGANWSWVRVGSIPACPHGAELVIHAKNPEGAANSHLHMDHYAVISAGSWAPAAEGQLDLQRFEERTLPIEVDPTPDPAAAKSTAYFFEITDPKFKVYRSLIWHGAIP